MFRPRIIIGVVVLLTGCDSEVQTSSSGTSAGGSGGSASSAGGGGGVRECSGFLGLECSSTEWCDYEPSTCGGLDQSGVCRPRPNGCDLSYKPVCGCDGVVHSNECDASANGTDINLNGGCTLEGGYFACGAGFCALATDYCVRIGSDVGGEPSQYTCKPLPSGCSQCDCLASEACGGRCEGDFQSGFTLTCLGG